MCVEVMSGHFCWKHGLNRSVPRAIGRRVILGSVVCQALEQAPQSMDHDQTIAKSLTSTQNKERHQDLGCSTTFESSCFHNFALVRHLPPPFESYTATFAVAFAATTLPD